MGKNKSRRKVRTEWAARVSAMQKIDNMLSKENKAKNRPKRNPEREKTA